jgi:glycosyltransferase involved in cell wall biosynthesis
MIKIAIASSGLGHVARGIETWARDTATALSEYGCNGVSECGCKLEVTLFSGAPLSSFILHPLALRSSSNAKSEAGSSFSLVVLPCLKRGAPAIRRLTKLFPGFTWRWGLKSEYGWEQLSFWWKLWPILRRENFDILHVQDPMLADCCRKFRKLGLVRTNVMLANGTEESMDFLEKFRFLQELSPHYAQRHQVAEGEKRKIFTIPNFVDTEAFKPSQESGVPASPTSYAAAGRVQGSGEVRKKYAIPEDAFVVGSVGAVNRGRKRMDYLIREFARFQVSSFTCPPKLQRRSILHPFLLIAGARCCDTDELSALAEQLAPGRVKFLFDVPREDMPDLYRVMDIFALCSVDEIFGIAFLEAMASGVPCIGHDYPVTKWIIGGQETVNSKQYTVISNQKERVTPNAQRSTFNVQSRAQESESSNRKISGNSTDSPPASSTVTSSFILHPLDLHSFPSDEGSSFSGGACIDMGKEGALADFLAGLTPEWIERSGKGARERAVRVFSKEAVIPQMIEMYEKVTEGK